MKNPPGGVLISPDADGWRLLHGSAAARKFPTLGEAAAALPLNVAVRLALPCQAALLERLTLPATDREELAGMVQLQLEKTLPYPVEEVSSDFEVIDTQDNESTLISVAAHSGQLDELCQPLRDRARLPQKITLFAMHVAAACPPDQTVLAIYGEQGNLVVAICEHGKLSWAQTVNGTGADPLISELPQLLLGAEMDGVPTSFAGLRLDGELASLFNPLRDYFGLAIEMIALDAPLPEPAGNLVPPSWGEDLRKIERGERFKQRLLFGAVLYLLAVAAAFVYLAWLKRETQKIGNDLAAARPQMDFIATQQRRWNDFRAATDPRFFPLEILHQVHRNLPSEQVRITDFTYTPAKWTIVGEAPSANLAIEYAEKIKAEPQLEAWKITSAAPVLLKGEQARFSIEGRP